MEGWPAHLTCPDRLKFKSIKSPEKDVSQWFAFAIERSVTTWKAGLHILPVLKETLSQSSYRQIPRLANPY